MISALLPFYFGVLIGFSLTEGFSYDRLDEWPATFCGTGQSQSPIDINTRDLIKHGERLPKLNLQSYIDNPITKLTLTNNGHTVVGTFNENIVINGGPAGRTDTYQLKSFHFHAGNGEHDGTEHAINGKQFAIEIHFVHMNTKYADLLTALGQKDGLIVIGVIGEIQHGQKSHALSQITENFATIPDANQQTVVEGPILLSQLIPNINNDDFSYYTYQGSLTTPNCDEAVTWIVNHEKLKVSNAQVKMFRTLRNHEGGPMTPNVRPLQDVNGRPVKYVHSKRWY